MERLNLDEQAVINSYEEIKNLREVGEVFGCSPVPIRRILKDSGVKMYKSNYKTPEKREARVQRMIGNVYKKGFKHTQEFKDNLSKQRAGKGNPQFGNRKELCPNWKRKHTKETRKKISKTRKKLFECGILDHFKGNNSNWKGGVTPERTRIWRSKEYQEWRKSVFTRDDYTCKDCGKNGGVQAHHIKTFGKYPELRFDVFNGITLCKSCHSAIRGTEQLYENKYAGMLV